MPHLQFVNGPRQWASYTVTGPRFTIGRRNSCHLTLDDGWVSREHTVIIETAQGEFLVRDLDSENGTFLNGERITESALRNLDTLRIGRTEMRFLFALPQDSRSPAPEEPLADEEPPTQPAAPPSWAEQTMAPGDDLDPEETTVPGSPPRRRGGEDVRERLRRLENLVTRLEDEKQTLGLQHMVLKRKMVEAGLINRETGSLALDRLCEAVARLPHLTWNPRARARFATPEGPTLEAGRPGSRERVPGSLVTNLLPGTDASRPLLAHFEALGYPATPREDEGAVTLNLLAGEVEIERGAQTRGEDARKRSLRGIWWEDLPDAQPLLRALDTATCDFALATSRERTAPDEGFPHPVAVMWDLFNRLWSFPDDAESTEVAPALDRWLREARLGTFCSAGSAAEEVDMAALVRTALGPGCFLKGSPPWSRARHCLCLILDGTPAPHAAQVTRLGAAAAEELGKHLPQAKVHVVSRRDHAPGLRLVLWVAGLPRLTREEKTTA